MLFKCNLPQGQKSPENSVQLCKRNPQNASCHVVVISRENDLWEHSDRFSLFHHTTEGHLEVAIRDLQNDSGTYECGSAENTVVIDDGRDIKCIFFYN